MNALIPTFIKGIAFGMTMALIPGPIFLLMIQRTLSEGFLIGFLCGLGAIAADIFFALIAAIGLSVISQWLLTNQSIISFIGGIFLLYLGITTYAKSMHLLAGRPSSSKGLTHAWFSTFLLTLTNPVTIVSYTMIFAALGLGQENLFGALSLVIGVVSGALCIMTMQVSFFSYFRHRFSHQALSLVTKIAGILLIGFGILALLRALGL